MAAPLAQEDPLAGKMIRNAMHRDEKLTEGSERYFHLVNQTAKGSWRGSYIMMNIEDAKGQPGHGSFSGTPGQYALSEGHTSVFVPSGIVDPATFSPRWGGQIIATRIKMPPSEGDQFIGRLADLEEGLKQRHEGGDTEELLHGPCLIKARPDGPTSVGDSARWGPELGDGPSFSGVFVSREGAHRVKNFYLCTHVASTRVGEQFHEWLTKQYSPEDDLSSASGPTIGEIVDSPEYRSMRDFNRRNALALHHRTAELIGVDIGWRDDHMAHLPDSHMDRPRLAVADIHSEYNLLENHTLKRDGSEAILYLSKTSYLPRAHGGIGVLCNPSEGVQVFPFERNATGSISESSPAVMSVPVTLGRVGHRMDPSQRPDSGLGQEDINAATARLNKHYTWTGKSEGVKNPYLSDFSYRTMDSTRVGILVDTLGLPKENFRISPHAVKIAVPPPGQR